MENYLEKQSEEYKTKFRELMDQKMLPAWAIGYIFCYPGIDEYMRNIKLEVFEEIKILHPEIISIN